MKRSKLLSPWLAPACLALALAMPAHADDREDDEEEWQVEFPEALLEELSHLSEQQMEFLESDRVERFVDSPEDLIEQLKRRDPEQVRAYVDAMMTVTEKRPFEEGRDLATLPLNTDSPEFNAWRVERPASFDPPREPGPININRYQGGGGRLGIPTFAGAPVALTPEDLIAGEVDVAIVGAPLNMGSGWRNADRAPNALRLVGRMSGLDQTTMVNTNELNIVDYGDIAVDQMSTERTVHHVRDRIREIAETGAVPVVIGGDHSLSYSTGAALADVYGKGNVGVMHFDAHWDGFGTGDRPHLLSHGQPVFRLIDEGHVNGNNYIQMGIRTTPPGDFRWMREQGMRYHTMATIHRYGWDKVIERALAEARDNTEHLMISFDVDALDPIYAPATGTPVSNGMTMREAEPLVRRLCAENDVVAFELVEVAPLVNPTDYITNQNSAAIVKACLVGLAMRKKGMEDSSYMSELSTEHGLNDYFNGGDHYDDDGDDHHGEED